MMFKPMLAASIDDTSSLRYPLMISPKLDGIRAMVQGGKLVSRNGKPIPNEGIQQDLGLVKLNGWDGELIVGSATDKNVFNTTTSGVMSRAGYPNYNFHVFDIHIPNMGFGARYVRLQKEVAAAKLSVVQVVPHAICSHEKDLRRVEAEFLKQGYEGLMVRSLDGLYKEGRSTAKQGWLLKLKQFKDAEAEVIGIEEQLHNGNTAVKNALGQLERSSSKAGMVGKNTMGALKVRGINGTFKGVEFSIGTGFDAAQRDAIWADRKLIGKVVTFKYFPIGCLDAPRFPVFKGFRTKGDM
jgi:DNA ligase-1